MDTPSEKHMLAAAALRNAVNWQSNGSIELIARALDNAEREGMKRAAEMDTKHAAPLHCCTKPHGCESNDGHCDRCLREAAGCAAA